MQEAFLTYLLVYFVLLCILETDQDQIILTPEYLP